MNPKIFFTSDQHYGHTNIIKYCKRPYKDVDEMNRDLITRHNSVVGPLDYVYHLGDFALMHTGTAHDILKKLNGAKHILVKGNHDKSLKVMKEVIGFDEVYEKLEWNGWMLQHHPIKTHKKLLCGHVHIAWRRIDDIINVGVDQWNYTPVTIEQLEQAIKDKSEYACKYCHKILHRLNKNEEHWDGKCQL
jgi:calcineurin-like phosphoesterase family protein